MRTPVLLMTHNLGIGGSERQMVEVAKSLDRGKFSPHVGCFHADGMRAAELRDAGVPILRLPVTSFASVSALTGGWQLMRYIWRNGIELVHSFDVPLNIFAAPFARLARRPALLTSQRAHRLLTPGAYHKLLRITDRLTDGIVVNCEFMRRHLIEDEGVSAQLVHLCHNGIDTRVFSPGPRDPAAPLTVGVVCALRPEKDLGTLVKAFARIAPEFPDSRLMVVGNGPELGGLQTRAAALKIGERCQFVPAALDVVPWLRKIDVFVLPSRSEALSNSLMEAMACGCCAVASNVGGNPELLGDSVRGVLFPAGDAGALAGALRELLIDRKRRGRLAEAARSFILAGFTRPVSVARMEEIYASVLQTKREYGEKNR